MGKSKSQPSTTLMSIKNNSNSGKLIICSGIIVVLFCFTVLINDIRIEHVLSIHKRAVTKSSSDANNTNSTAIMINSSSKDELRILIGILTLADNYRHRDFLRRIYQVQPRPAGVRADLKFVFCNLTTESQKIQIQLEIMAHDDIIILNCAENMDRGKTYTYFSSLPSMFSDTGLNPPYHYIMKTDDDSFLRIPNLAESLKPLPRKDLYYGFAFPCKNMAMRGDYMSGMGYVLSWDIVEWISESDIPRKLQKGPEDWVTGEWLKRGRKGKNSFNAKWKMYFYPKPGSPWSFCSHPLSPDTILIHFLKSTETWVNTLSYFNFTKDRVKPSKLLEDPTVAVGT